jgi:hypothetical protein
MARMGYLLAGFAVIWVVAGVFNIAAICHRRPGVPLFPVPFSNDALLTDKGIRLKRYALYIAIIALLWLGIGAAVLASR